MKKKKWLVIVTAIEIIILLLIILRLFFAIKNNEYGNLDNNTKYEYDNSLSPFENIAAEDYQNKKIVPEYWTTVTREYTGKGKAEDWYSKLFVFVQDYIPKIRENDADTFYDANAKKIQKDIGINRKADFVELAKQVKLLDQDTKYTLSEFNTETMETTNEGVSVDIVMYFSMGETLTMRFTAYNDSSNISLFAVNELDIE